jgi:hypothetical protein
MAYSAAVGPSSRLRKRTDDWTNRPNMTSLREIAGGAAFRSPAEGASLGQSPSPRSGWPESTNRLSIPPMGSTWNTHARTVGCPKEPVKSWTSIFHPQVRQIPTRRSP